jgi:hypothetical protein
MFSAGPVAVRSFTARWSMLGSMAFKVTCTGKISGSARAKLGEKGIKVAQGGSGPSGRRYSLHPVKAKDAEAAVDKAKAAVERLGASAPSSRPPRTRGIAHRPAVSAQGPETRPRSLTPDFARFRAPHRPAGSLPESSIRSDSRPSRSAPDRIRTCDLRFRRPHAATSQMA